MSKSKFSFFSLIFIFGTLMFFTSCAEDEEITEISEEDFLPLIEFPGVDPELWPHFSEFEDEAAARGLDIDLVLSRITGEISEIAEEHVAGRCNFFNRAPNAVTIDQTFWDRANDLFREFVVFHELGHCFLGRGHEEGTNIDGTCVSIMRSGVEDCRDNYRTSNRETYLDELFDAMVQ